MRFALSFSLVLLFAAMPAAVRSQTVPPASSRSDAEIKLEERQAQDLYVAQKFTAAVPLYEDLHQQRPTSTVYTDKLAMSLLGSSGTLSGDAKIAQARRARKLLLEAKAAGDTSNLVQVLLEETATLDAPAGGATPPPVGQEFITQGEAAFGRGDLSAALGFYQQAYDANPKLYAAALFAGDTEYKLHHPEQAGQWFAKAVTINPDRETAWRYWGDCLDSAGEHQQAEQKFIQAIVAEPYQRASRVGLKQWADRNHAMLAGPPLKIPQRSEPNAKGGFNVNLDPASLSDPAAAPWILYPVFSVSWRDKQFAEHYPNEKTYRHSLAEEAAALRTVLTIAHQQKLDFARLKDPTLKILEDLDKAGMLECFILLDRADQGIAQDYADFRAQHREKLAEYIAKYDVHPM